MSTKTEFNRALGRLFTSVLYCLLLFYMMSESSNLSDSIRELRGEDTDEKFCVTENTNRTFAGKHVYVIEQNCAGLREFSSELSRKHANLMTIQYTLLMLSGARFVQECVV